MYFTNKYKFVQRLCITRILIATDTASGATRFISPVQVYSALYSNSLRSTSGNRTRRCWSVAGPLRVGVVGGESGRERGELEVLISERSVCELPCGMQRACTRGTIGGDDRSDREKRERESGGRRGRGAPISRASLNERESTTLT